MALFAFPYGVVMATFVVASVAIACGAHVFVRRIVPYDDLVAHNEVAGFLIAVVGVLYSVLIAFVVVVVWQQYNASDVNYGSEVSAVADIHAYARSLPRERGRFLQRLAHRYIGEMIADEWPAMRAGRSSAAATGTIAAMLVAAQQARVTSSVQADARTRVLDAIQHLFDLRNRRLADNTETLPAVLWASLVFGALVTVGFGYLFGVGRLPVQLIMTGCVAALIAVMFALLVELDYPFQRDMALPADRWVELERFLDIPGEDATRVRPRPFAWERRASRRSA